MALEAISTDPNVDAVLVIAMMVPTMPLWSALDVLQKYAEAGVKKPTVVCGFRDDEGMKQLSHLETKGLAVYSSVTSAIKALAAACARYQYLNRKEDQS